MKYFTSLLLSITPLFLFSQVQIGEDFNGMNPNDELGMSVDISDDGNTIVFGAPGYNSVGGFLNGKVEVYSRVGNEWEQKGNIIEGEYTDFNGSEWGDNCGASVALSSNNSFLAVGSPYA